MGLSDAQRLRSAIRVLLRATGDDNLERDNLLIDTPDRVAKAWGEWFEGYAQDPKEILSKSFEDTSKYEGVVLLRKIHFDSHCEHHLAPIRGIAHVGYLPGEDGRVIGLSKLARLVHCFSRRLQMQERLTAQIADALMTHLHARGVAVVIQASHGCMTTRGVRTHATEMITSEMRGVYRDDPAARSEILSFLNMPCG